MHMLKVDDQVIVVRGKHAGLRGRVAHLAAGPRSNKVAVDLDHPVQRLLGPDIINRRDLVAADDGDEPARAPIRWIRARGRVADITRTPGGGVYAKSHDGRFIVWTHRYLGGSPGDRAYRYYFEVTDYGIPSGGQRFTSVPVEPGRSDSQNVQKVMAAAERWAEQNPATASWSRT